MPAGFNLGELLPESDNGLGVGGATELLNCI